MKWCIKYEIYEDMEYSVVKFLFLDTVRSLSHSDDSIDVERFRMNIRLWSNRNSIAQCKFLDIKKTKNSAFLNQQQHNIYCAKHRTKERNNPRLKHVLLRNKVQVKDKYEYILLKRKEIVRERRINIRETLIFKQYYLKKKARTSRYAAF